MKLSPLDASTQIRFAKPLVSVPQPVEKAAKAASQPLRKALRLDVKA